MNKYIYYNGKYGIIYNELAKNLVFGKNKIIKSEFKITFEKNIFTKINKKSKYKILDLKYKKDMDKFNEKYGYIKNNELKINWKKVKKDYAGLKINKNIKYNDYHLDMIYKNNYYHNWLDKVAYPFKYGNIFDCIIWRGKNIVKKIE